MWCFRRASNLVTYEYGLAFNPRTFASPHHTNGDRFTISAGQRPCPAPSRLAEHPKPRDGVSCGRRRRRRPQESVGLEGVETRRSDADQQSLAQQDGQRHQEAARERGGVHNAGAAHRPGDGGDRLLAVGQLLVAGSRRARGDRGLTNGEAPPQPRHLHQRGERVLVDGQLATLEPRQRLAPGGAFRRRLHQSLTARQRGGRL